MTIDVTLPETAPAPTTEEIMAAHVGRQALHGPDRAPARRPRPVHLLHPGRRAGQPRDRRRPLARRPLHLDAAPGRGGQRRHGRARPRRHRPPRRAAGDGGQVGAVQDLRRARLHPAGARHHRRRRDRRDPRAAASQLRRGEPRRRLRAALLRAGAPADRGARLPGHARRPARHRDRPARRAPRGVCRGGTRPGPAADRDLRCRSGGGGLRADPARRRGHGRRRARLARRARARSRGRDRREGRPCRRHQPPPASRAARPTRSPARTCSWACRARGCPRSCSP